MFFRVIQDLKGGEKWKGEMREEGSSVEWRGVVVVVAVVVVVVE